MVLIRFSEEATTSFKLHCPSNESGCSNRLKDSLQRAYTKQVANCFIVVVASAFSSKNEHARNITIIYINGNRLVNCPLHILYLGSKSLVEESEGSRHARSPSKVELGSFPVCPRWFGNHPVYKSKTCN